MHAHAVIMYIAHAVRKSRRVGAKIGRNVHTEVTDTFVLKERFKLREYNLEVPLYTVFHCCMYYALSVAAMRVRSW